MADGALTFAGAAQAARDREMIQPSGPASFAQQEAPAQRQDINAAIEDALLMDLMLDPERGAQVAPQFFQQEETMEQQLQRELSQSSGVGGSAPPQTTTGQSAPQDLLNALAEEAGFTKDGSRRSLKVKGPLSAFTEIQKPEPLRRTRAFFEDILDSGLLTQPTDRPVGAIEREQLRQNINLAFELAKGLRETDQEEQRLHRELSGKAIEASVSIAEAKAKAEAEALGKLKKLPNDELNEIDDLISMADLVGPATRIVNAIDGMRDTDPFANVLVNEFNDEVLGKINELQNQVTRRILDLRDKDPATGKARVDPKKLRIELRERQDALGRIRKAFLESLVGTLQNRKREDPESVTDTDIQNIKFLAINLYDNLNRRFERVAWSFASAVNGGRITEADIEAARALMNPFELSAGWDDFVGNLANIDAFTREDLQNKIRKLPDVYSGFITKGPVRGLTKALDRLDTQFDFTDASTLAVAIRDAQRKRK